MHAHISMAVYMLHVHKHMYQHIPYIYIAISLIKLVVNFQMMMKVKQNFVVIQQKSLNKLHEKNNMYTSMHACT